MTLTMVGDLQPLERQFPIVDQDGRPTVYFIRWAQQRMQDIQGAVSPEQALEIATNFVLEFLAANPLAAGVGIDLSPSGNIADGVTISANTQAILDVISSTQGAILYRGATEWEALAPGTAGQILQTGGAGADPSWITGGGGGGGAPWVLVSSVDLSVSPATAVPFTGLGAYSEILLVGVDVTTATSTFRGLEVSVNNGTSYFNTSGDYKRTAVTGIVSNQIQIDGISAASAAARSYYIQLLQTNINGAPKPYFSTANLPGFFSGSMLPINAVRAVAGSNYTSGFLYLLGR